MCLLYSETAAFSFCALSNNGASSVLVLYRPDDAQQNSGVDDGEWDINDVPSACNLFGKEQRALCTRLCKVSRELGLSSL